MIEKELAFRLFEESKRKYVVKLRERAILSEAKKYLGYKEALVITGVRRCGKTSLMFSLMQHLDVVEPDSSKVYINFEDERLAFMEPKDLDRLMEYYLEFEQPRGKIYFFIDEIQNVSLWEKWISRSYESYTFVVSGSNANLLSSDLATALTGRHKEIRVYPFQFNEYYSSSDLYSIEGAAKAKAKFSEYLKKGGFPESLLKGKTDMLQEYYKNILLKDVVGRYNIKYKDLLQKLSLFILSNSSKQISSYALEKRYDAGINTIRNYVSYLESSFLIFSLPYFSHSVKKQQQNPSKLYAIDVALAESVAFHFSEDKGRVLENVVLVNLKTKFSEIFYHREKKECDFVIKEGLNITSAIQVCYELTDENKKREVEGLIEACKIHSLSNGLLLTYDQEDEFDVEGVKISVKPVWRWLLE
jgi:hypothetical protein